MGKSKKNEGEEIPKRGRGGWGNVNVVMGTFPLSGSRFFFSCYLSSI
jgi:hypothetical protein